MSWIGAALSVGGSLLGGSNQADAAESAGQAQLQATEKGIAEQRRQYDATRADLLRQYEQARTDTAPYRDAGAASVTRLRQMLGLGTGPVGGSAAARRTVDDFAQELRSSGRFGSAMPQTGIGSPIRRGRFDISQSIWANDPDFLGSGGTDSVQQYINELGRIPTREEMLAAHYGVAPAAGGIDEAGLMAEAQRLYDAQPTASVTASDLPAETYTAAQPFGSSPLLRRVTQADIDNDPVYQSGLRFGLEEGEKAVNARATQMGQYDSGATLKALTRFGNDYGSTKAGESAARFNVDQGNVYNRLAGLAGTGQTSTGQVVGAGGSTAGTIANLGASNAGNIANMVTDAGNARAASIVGGANAWSGAADRASGAYNNYQSQQMLEKILGGRKSTTSYGGWQAGDDWY